jgi:hypothetical protein
MLLVGGWLRWPGDCSSSRLTVLLLGRLLGVLLFIEGRSMGRAVQWSPMKPESWSDWFPLKSSPTYSYGWLHCDLQTCRANRRIQVKTLLATIHVAFVGCHGNPVYWAVIWIRICVSVTWSPVFPTCGMFPWKAPTQLYQELVCVYLNPTPV